MKKEGGFTLLEVLVSFSLFLMLMSFVPLLIKMTKEYYNETITASKLEWEVFLKQLTIEMREGHSVKEKEGILTFTNFEGKVISYEQYGQVLRRRVNGTGHEVMLQNIASVQYTKVSNSIIIKVKDLNGHIYSERISLFIDGAVNDV